MWANISEDACHNPYGWACGKFEHEYQNHGLHGLVDGGEWNVRKHSDYEGTVFFLLIFTFLYSLIEIIKTLFFIF